MNIISVWWPNIKITHCSLWLQFPQLGFFFFCSKTSCIKRRQNVASLVRLHCSVAPPTPRLIGCAVSVQSVILQCKHIGTPAAPGVTGVGRQCERDVCVASGLVAWWGMRSGGIQPAGGAVGGVGGGGVKSSGNGGIIVSIRWR